MHMTKSPGLPPQYLHTAGNQILKVGTRLCNGGDGSLYMHVAEVSPENELFLQSSRITGEGYESVVTVLHVGSCTISL